MLDKTNTKQLKVSRFSKFKDIPRHLKFLQVLSTDISRMFKDIKRLKQFKVQRYSKIFKFHTGSKFKDVSRMFKDIKRLKKYKLPQGSKL